jgi:hypothetical protein
MTTDADILYYIEVSSAEFAKASGAHARALVRMCNHPCDLHARRDEREAMAAKERAFTLLSNQIASLADHGHPGLARTLLQSAIANADFAERLGSVESLDAIPMEAA